MTEAGLTSQEVPKTAKMETVSNEYCLLDQPKTGHIASNRTFCAIGKSAGPCKGDSGENLP